MKKLIILFASVQIGFVPAAPRLFGDEPRVPDGGRANVLLLTVDDLGYGSLGVTGCTIQGIERLRKSLGNTSVYSGHE